MTYLVVAAALLIAVQPAGDGKDGAKKAPPAELLVRLKSKDAKTRLQAVQEAGGEGNSLTAKEVRTLIECLDDADPKIRKAAAQSVGEAGPHARTLGGGPKVADALGKLLQDKTELVRRSAVWAYGQIGIDTQEELKTLTSALKDKSADVRGLALAAIGEYLHEDVPLEWRKMAFADIAAVLGDTDGRVQKMAAQKLVAVGPDAVEAVTKVVQEGKGNARLWAAIVLGEFGPAAADAVPALQKAMSEVPVDRRPILQQSLKKIQP